MNLGVVGIFFFTSTHSYFTWKYLCIHFPPLASQPLSWANPKTSFMFSFILRIFCYPSKELVIHPSSDWHIGSFHISLFFYRTWHVLSILKLKCFKNFHLFLNEPKIFSTIAIFLFMLQSNANIVKEVKGTKEKILFQGLHNSYVGL